MNPTAIALRDVSADDRPYLLELYTYTREAEMALVPWTTEQKQAFVALQFEAQLSGYSASYPQATHQMICEGGIPVGRLYLSRETERMHILDITIALTFRNRGIGSVVMRDLLQEADRDRKAVSVYVESFNPSLRLFERLGFRTLSADGFLLLLDRAPSPYGASESSNSPAADRSGG